MQERYLGDSHDFAKYALLNHLHRSLGLRIGLNWYLTHGDRVDKLGNKDGEKRHHFGSRVWMGWEDELLRKLSHLQLASNRQLGRFYSLEILPAETIYMDAHVPTAERDMWHQSALTALRSTDLVFIDPDNGFEVPSMTRRTRPKYAFYAEALDYVSAGKVVVAIQFARQCDPIQRALSVRQKLSQLIGRDIRIPVLRARLAPNLLFVTVSPEPMESVMAAAVTSFARGREKVELIA